MAKKNQSFFRFLLVTLILWNLGSAITNVKAQQGYPPPQPTQIVQSQSFSFGNHVFLPNIALQHIPYSYRSFYIANTANMVDLGKIRGSQNANLTSPITDLAILFFGEPQMYAMPDGSNGYGTLLYDSITPRYIMNSDVQTAVKDFVAGYLQGSATNPSSYLNVIVAVNTSGMWINEGHGKSWGDMIEYLNYDWLPTQTGASQVHIYGGMDIEPGNYSDFNSPPVVKRWLKGYATVDLSHRYQYRKLYAIAAASGCPDSPDKNTTYGTNVSAGICGDYISDDIGNTYRWTQEDLYQLTWYLPSINSYPDIYPIPQIYAQPSPSWPDNGIHARQWYKIALYTYLKHNKITIHFNGVITQQAACDYNKNHGSTWCFDAVPPQYNARVDALRYLQNELLTDPYGRMTIQDLNWSTDVGFYEGQP